MLQYLHSLSLNIFTVELGKRDKLLILFAITLALKQPFTGPKTELQSVKCS